jgi:hypothetical protein
VEGRVFRHVLQHGRLDEGAVTPASGEHLCPLGSRVLNPPLHTLSLGLGDHRPHVSGLVEFVANPVCGGVLHEPIPKDLEDVAVDVDPLHPDAVLPGGPKRTRDARLDRPVEVRIVPHDHG